MAASRSKQAGGNHSLEPTRRWAAQALQYEFVDLDILDQALTHKSVGKKNNERLEFLGDAFLNLVITTRLYAVRPEDDEGRLSRLRASLVKGVTLAEIGRKIRIDEHIRLGPGEKHSGGARRGSTIANAVEAVLGAVLLDGGHDAARNVVERLFDDRLGALPDAEALKDAKTRLQEWLQARAKPLPSYRIESVAGSPHDQVFSVRCEADGADALAEGSSRRKAEQNAAAALLSQLELGE